ncbi:hypothetical protein [Luteimonas terricola]|uniref:Uncharacterized protein n=1 Tax=Luteimonas terricola TaxID=645597 RepID=A0ABQ2EED1_9GAMM|nr:hypothetical protein [Luteimonas terricola]GGK08622.1 hypothetical protein GCM10011394_17490 [Luteimonas terricola]
MTDANATALYPVLTTIKFGGRYIKPPGSVEATATEAAVLIGDGYVGPEASELQLPEGDDQGNQNSKAGETGRPVTNAGVVGEGLQQVVGGGESPAVGAGTEVTLRVEGADSAGDTQAVVKAVAKTAPPKKAATKKAAKRTAKKAAK